MLQDPAAATICAAATMKPIILAIISLKIVN
jgi:hypothetical protein